MIYVCSDWHLLHDKDFIYKPRGYESAEEMTEDIIKKHNEIVKPDDIIYVLGDCVVGGPPTAEHAQLLKRFNGRKYLAFGNHDTDHKLEAYANADVFEHVEMGYRLRYKHIEFYLTHYPMLVSNYDDPKPIYGLFGHTHQKTNFYENNYHMYHVGMDSHDCYPISLDDILAEISTVKNDQSNSSNFHV